MHILAEPRDELDLKSYLNHILNSKEKQQRNKERQGNNIEIMLKT